MIPNKKQIIITSTFLAVLLPLTPPLFAYELANRFRSVIFKNGLCLFILKRLLNPTVSIYRYYRAGVVDESDGKT